MSDKHVSSSGFQYTLSNLKPVDSRTVTLTFPDGAHREFPKSTTGLDIAKGISPSLAKRTVAMALDGTLTDLNDPIEHDAKIEFVNRDDPRALELIRHDCAHVLAEAVQTLWPGTQVTIGPVIENGFYYDFFRNEPFTPEDFAAIEKKMREIIARDAPFTKDVWDREKTKQVFRDKGEAFKVELVDAIPGDEPIKIYYQGDWFDLCRGPHMTSTGKIGNAFKLMKVAGAYWRGDSKNEMLQRIYGTAWATKEEQEAYLHMLEEAERRDHRKIGRELDLFHFQDEAPGLIFWHPKGWALWQQVEQYMRSVYRDNGYQEVKAPQILDISLWKKTGHWDNYRENMFTTESENRVYGLKPMNCPGHVQIFNAGLHSYRELPLRYGEFGQCHRNEPSGSLHGMMRVRGFTQDDGHIFCTEEQLQDECADFTALLQKVYRDFGFTEVLYKVATRPEKRIGSDEVWDTAEQALMESLRRTGCEFEISPGEGAFYGPKVEYTLKDAIGRHWQCGTIQVDFSMPVRLGAEYVDQNDQRRPPVMLHRAILGSLERFIGMLIENHAGAMPPWLAPVQAVVCCISEPSADYAAEITQSLKKQGFRVESDLRGEKITRKIREHSLQKVPYILVVGDKEKQNGTVAVRGLGGLDLGAIAFDDFVARLSEDVSTRRDVNQPDGSAA